MVWGGRNEAGFASCKANTLSVLVSLWHTHTKRHFSYDLKISKETGQFGSVQSKLH